MAELILHCCLPRFLEFQYVDIILWLQVVT